MKALILIIVWGRCDYLKVALIVCPQFRVLVHLGGGAKTKNASKPSSLLLQIFLFAVPLGNSERIAGDGVRRSHAGKSKAKNDLSCQRGIWWLPEARRWEPRRRACMRAECRCADNHRRCAQPKRTFLGQWFFSTSTGCFFLPPSARMQFFYAQRLQGSDWEPKSLQHRDIFHTQNSF